MPLLSFVIPCYRSEKTIGMVIEEIIETVSQKKNTIMKLSVLMMVALTMYMLF